MHTTSLAVCVALTACTHDASLDLDVPIDGKADSIGKKLHFEDRAEIWLGDYALLSHAERQAKLVDSYGVIADSADKLVIDATILLEETSTTGPRLFEIGAENLEPAIQQGFVLTAGIDGDDIAYVTCGGGTLVTHMLVDGVAHEITADNKKTFSFDDCGVKRQDDDHYTFGIIPVPIQYRGLLEPGEIRFHITSHVFR